MPDPVAIAGGLLAGLAMAVALHRPPCVERLATVAGGSGRSWRGERDRTSAASAGAPRHLGAPGEGGARRVTGTASSPEGNRRGEEGAPTSGVQRRALPACMLAAAAAAVTLPWALAAPVALALLVGGPRVLGRLEPAAVRRQRERMAADLPLVLDLLGACLAGGASPGAAAAAVAGAVGGPVGVRLERVGTALTVGMPGSIAWLHLADPDGRSEDLLGAAARSLARSADGGTRLADVLLRLAEEERRRARSRGAEAARRAGVLAVAPLGLCHLPSFVLLGVVPVIAGLAAPLLAQM